MGRIIIIFGCSGHAKKRKKKVMCTRRINLCYRKKMGVCVNIAPTGWGVGGVMGQWVKGGVSGVMGVEWMPDTLFLLPHLMTSLKKFMADICPAF